MAWFVLHCECLMSAPGACPEGEFIPFVQRLETCSWKLRDMIEMRKTLDFFGSYDYFRSFPYFPGGGYGESLRDASTSDRRTILTLGSFRWLVNIRPGYHLFRSGSLCSLEPYLPSRFSRQFGYDQLYVGNINPHLRFEGGLVDGARGWFWTQAGCTGARFELPQRGRLLHQTFTYCKWYRSVSVPPEGFDLYRSCLPERQRRSRSTSRSSRRRGRHQAESSEAVQPEEHGAATTEGAGTAATEEVWETGPHLLYSPSQPGFGAERGIPAGLHGVGTPWEQAGGDVAERLQRSLFSPTPPSPLKRQREEGTHSGDEREAKRVYSEEAPPEVGLTVPSPGVSTVAIEQPVLIQPDMPITLGGADSAAAQVSSGSEDEDASYHEAAFPLGGSGAGEGAPILQEGTSQTKVLPLEEETPAPGVTSTQEDAPARLEEVPAHVEEMLGVGETPFRTEEISIRSELPVHTEATLGGEEASTQVAPTAGGVVPTSFTEDTPLSPPARIKRRLVENTIQNFESLLRDSVQMALDGSGSFGELLPALQMYVNNLVTLMGVHAASAYQRRLMSAETGISELLTLRSTSLVEVASTRERDAREQWQRSMDELKAQEDELAKAVEQIVAEGKAAEEDLRSAKSFLVETDKSIAEAQLAIEELQALLTSQTAVREQALKRLEELEGRQQLTIADLEEKNKALEATRSKLGSTASLTEEDLRRQIMADLEEDHQRKLQEAESRLRGF